MKIDEWKTFWNDPTQEDLTNVFHPEVEKFGVTLYPDLAYVLAALTMDDMHKIIEKNGETFKHLLHKGYFSNMSDVIKIRSHKNRKVVYNIWMIQSVLKYFSVDCEMTFEVFIEKRAPAFLHGKGFENWALLVMPMYIVDPKFWEESEELPREELLSLDRWS